MHFMFQATFGLLIVLWSFINGSAAAGATQQPKAIWETKCWHGKTTRGNAKDCAAALDLLESASKAGGVQSGYHDGCTEIVRFGDCGIGLCNQRPANTGLSLGPVLAAAQIQHALCSNQDGTTGGITAIEGYEQIGEEHTYAEIHLATASLTRDDDSESHEPEPDKTPQPTTDGNATPAPAATPLIQPRARRYAKRTQWLVREQWTDHNSAADEGNLSSQRQSALVNRVLNNWNSDNGQSTTRRSARGSVSDSDGHTWTLAFDATQGSNTSSIPIVDREPVLDAFFTMRGRIGRQHLGPANEMSASVLNERTNTVVGHLTLIMVGAIPELDGTISMPGLRGVVMRVSGSQI